MTDKQLLEKVRADTGRRYKDERLNCAESVLWSVLENLGHPCPGEYLAMTAGLGQGMGGAGCSCGSLTGGVLALGVCLADRDLSRKAARALYDVFTAKHRAACCRVLHKGLVHGSPEQIDTCMRLAADTAVDAVTIIREFLARKTAETATA